MLEWLDDPEFARLEDEVTTDDNFEDVGVCVDCELWLLEDVVT